DPAYLDHLGSNRFDVIVANVLSGVLIPLLPAFRRSLAEGGRLILGGILEQEAPDVVAAASDAGLVLRASDTEQEWWTGRFGRLEDMRGGGGRGAGARHAERGGALRPGGGEAGGTPDVRSGRGGQAERTAELVRLPNRVQHVCPRGGVGGGRVP